MSSHLSCSKPPLKLSPISMAASYLTDEWRSPPGGFDCNICLENVQDPVVTICGHLYCWPCIYKWIHQQQIISSAIPLDLDDRPQCPVCKSEISEQSLIPLYGRGQSDEKDDDLGPVIPPRPKGPPHEAAMMSQSDHGYRLAPAPDGSLAGSLGGSFFMISAGFFGSSEWLHMYRNSYGVVFSGSPRARRRVRQADRTLSRLSFFLGCCLVFCLVLF